MVTTSKLNLEFRDANGNAVKFSYNYAKSDISSSAVKSLMQGMITNGDAFTNVPASIYSADIVTTTTTELDVEE